jgi:hypothetical protein
MRLLVSKYGQMESFLWGPELYPIVRNSRFLNLYSRL